MIRIAQSSDTESCHDWDDDVDEKSNGISHELCKVVRCIEAEDLIPKAYVDKSYCSSPDTKIRVSSQAVFHDNDDNHGDDDDHSENPEVLNSGEYMPPKMVEATLKEDGSKKPPLKEERKLESASDNKDCFHEDFIQSFKLLNSRSCNEGIYARWLNKLENTPPNGYDTYYTGRPLGFPTKSSTFNYGVEFENGSHSPEGSINHNGNEAEKILTTEEDTSVKRSSISATKEPAKAQHDNQLEDTKIATMERIKIVKSIGLDPIED